MKYEKNPIRYLPINIQGYWTNQLGSTLYIQSISANGFLNGHYRSAKGTKGEPFPLFGFIHPIKKKNGSPTELIISFTVKWDGYNSITSWIGYLEHNGSKTQLRTSWQLINPLKSQGIMHISTDKDIFYRSNSMN